MNRKPFLAVIVAVAALSCSRVFAATEYSRSRDFQVAGGGLETAHEHGGLLAVGTSRWSYYLLSAEQRRDVEDLGPLLSEPEVLTPLTGFAESAASNGFVRHSYKASADGVSLYWNRNADNPPTELANADLAIFFHPPAAGTYSITGELLWRCTTTARMNHGAGLTIGVLRGVDGSFDRLLEAPCAAETAFPEPKPVEGFAGNPALLNLELAVNDCIVFVWHSDGANYRGLEGIDRGVRIVHLEGEPLPTEPEGIAALMTVQRLFELIDLDYPGLEKVRALVAEQRLPTALDAYRDVLVARFARAQVPECPGYWLWRATDPDRLVAEGEVGYVHYGEETETTHYVIGKPGSVEWHKLPEDGYAVVLRDLSTMHWLNTLPRAYEKNPDPAYARAWLGYWADFGDNFMPSFQRLMRDKELLATLDPGVVKSIPWSIKSLMYHGCRLTNFLYGLPVICRGPEAETRIDSLALARVLLYLTDGWEIRDSRYRLQHGGAPNQQVHCASGVMALGCLLPEFDAAADWRTAAVSAMDEYLAGSGYLADGADMEQSFNYNPSLLGGLSTFLTLAENPIGGQAAPAWVDHYRHCRDYRSRFLAVLALPDGRLPSIGCGNNWYHSRKIPDGKGGYTYETRRFSRSLKVAEYEPPGHPTRELKEQIENHLFGDGSLAAPAFTSVYFPYGGYVVLRDAWSPTADYAFMKTSRPGPGHMREGGNGLVLCANGDYLLVNSADMAYSKRGNYSKYFFSTISQNSICVDGYAQILRDGSKVAAYTEPIDARWYTDADFDFAEGIFAGTYGKWNYRTNREDEGTQVDDVRHTRQLIFLRKLGLWIVADRIATTGSHDYTQSWNLHPRFTPAEVTVDPETRRFATNGAASANLGFYQFGDVPLTYRTFHGVHTDEATLGWVAIETEPGAFTPAVDVLAEWPGTGDQLLVTLIEGRAGRESRIAELKVTPANGFAATLDDGTSIDFRSVLEPAALTAGSVQATATMLLTVRGPGGNVRGIVLDCTDLGGHQPQSPDFAFAVREGRPEPTAPIAVLSGFRWETTEAGIQPAYENGEPQ